MVLDPIPQSLPVHFFGSRPQPPTSHIVLDRASTNNTSTIGEFVHKRGRNNLQSQRYSCVYIQYHIENYNVHQQTLPLTLKNSYIKWGIFFSKLSAITVITYSSALQWVSYRIAEYRLFYRALLQKRPIIFRSLLIDFIQFSITVSIVRWLVGSWKW